MSSAAERKRAYLAWLVVCLVWGTTYLAIKFTLESIPPFLIGGLRYLIAGSLLFGALRLKGYAMPSRGEWIGAFIAGALLLGVGNGGVVWAELWVPSGFAAVLVACVPFWMVGIEAAWPGGEPITRRALLGLLVGFLGIVLLVWPNLTLEGADAWKFGLGVVILQIACLGWAAGSAYSRRRKVKGDPVMFAAIQMLCGGVLMFAAGLASGEWPRLTFTSSSASALAYLVVAGSLIGYVAYVYALTHLSATFVSLYAYVNPMVAVALGTLVLGEPFGWRMVGAIAIILVGMAIVSTKKPAAVASGASVERRAPPDGARPLETFASDEHRSPDKSQAPAVQSPSPRSSTA